MGMITITVIAAMMTIAMDIVTKTVAMMDIIMSIGILRNVTVMNAQVEKNHFGID